MIEELKTFMEVVDKKSFTKAANAINISQPSASLHIAHLESYFNTKLIERSNKQRNILITPTGEMLYNRAKQILALLEDTKDELNSYHNSPFGTLKLGASMTIGEFLLPAILGDFVKLYPNIKLEVTIQNTKDIYNKFINYELDIALIEGRVPVENYSYNNFYKDTMVLVVPKSFKVESTENVDIKEYLSNQTWIHREEGSGTGEYLKIFLESEGISPKNFIILGSNYAIKEAVRNNLGITFISSLVVDEAIKREELKVIPLKSEFNRYFSYLVHEGENLSKTAMLFLERLQNLNKS
jgi:DNA-binding transcriptional LysR family regulator